MMARVATTLVTGPSAGAREQAIAALLSLPAVHECGRSASVESDAHASQSPTSAPAKAEDGPSAVILEGLGIADDPLVSSPSLNVVRIAPGCLCCDGNLVLRVTLNRLLRQRPQRLFIGLARSEHLDQLRSWLLKAPYDQLLALNPVVEA
jgi:hypothetical protein